jgi:hypothetical protein
MKPRDAAAVRCEVCTRPMSLTRTVPAPAIKAEFQSFECGRCGHTTTRRIALATPPARAGADAGHRAAKGLGQHPLKAMGGRH